MGQMLAPKHICAYPMRPAERLDDSAAGQCRIPTEEKIAGCQTLPVSDPALRQVMRPIMQHAAALTERQEVFPSVVGRIAVEMRPGEHSSETQLPPQARGHRPSTLGDPAEVAACSSNHRPSGRSRMRARCGRRTPGLIAEPSDRRGT